MQYYQFKSIVASKKNPITLEQSSTSIYVSDVKEPSYIEPCFSKVEFSKEKPSILLVSATGAAGKTTTARALSFDTKLPILDLAKHKAVGDNTLTGILTTAFPIEQVGNILEGFRKGTQGIIIDGIDEGRSKTTEEGFEAFLDDLIQRSQNSPSTVIVIFGRGQILFSTWCYLVDKGADVGLVEIEPFTLEQAKAYIDAQVPNRNENQKQNYEAVRDDLLGLLGAAFDDAKSDAFLTFIGYPPVLDSIGTLLREETNYYRIQQSLKGKADGQVEISLLVRICDYLMNRERNEKALPNFIRAIVCDADEGAAENLLNSLYDKDEQSARVLSQALGAPFMRKLINDNALNERYEKAVESWCPDHPFLSDMRLRNAVFEAASLARCILSDVQEYRELALEYAKLHRSTYHLVYIMDVMGKGVEIDAQFFNILVQSCSEFMGKATDITIEIAADSWEDTEDDAEFGAELVMTVAQSGKMQERSFAFFGKNDVGKNILLGPYLINAQVTLPCHVELNGRIALEVFGECCISARHVRIETPDLIVRKMGSEMSGDVQNNAILFIDAQKVEGHADTVSLKDNKLQIQCSEYDLDYPLAKFVQRTPKSDVDQTLWAKYLRMRRIFMEFRSHSKGGLAKYRDKIEHVRVLKNNIGKSVLDELVKENILTADSRLYHVNQEHFNTKLGITWQELRQHKISERLKIFLKNINVE